MNIPTIAKEIIIRSQLDKAKATAAEWDMCVEHDYSLNSRR